MDTIIHSSIGGTVEQTGPHQLSCRYRGLFYSVLLMLVLIVWTAGAVMMFVGAVLDRKPELIVMGCVGLVACGVVVGILRFRWRRMGSFLIDVAAGSLTFTQGKSVKGQWPLPEVTFARRWDPLHRGFSTGYWLVAIVPDGRGLRLAKGSAAAMDQLLRSLASWGLRAETGFVRAP